MVRMGSGSAAGQVDLTAITSRRLLKNLEASGKVFVIANVIAEVTSGTGAEVCGVFRCALCVRSCMYFVLQDLPENMNESCQVFSLPKAAASLREIPVLIDVGTLPMGGDQGL